MKHTILFVDDEINILQGLQRNLRKMRNEWDMVFFNSGAAVLDHIASNHIDVIVTDMRMPVMDGAELLTKVAEHAPRTIRFVLSGQTDREESLRLVGVCHQFLSKPCDTGDMVKRVQRALALRDILPDHHLQTQVAKLNDLPSKPVIYDQIVEELSLDDPSVEKISALVSQDIALAAKLLKISSSGFFSAGRSMPSLTEAVSQLGVRRVKALVVSHDVVSKHQHSATGGLSLEALWDHSVSCASVSQAIAQAEQCDTKTVESAFVAGLVHDIGRLLLAADQPEQYEAAMAGVDDVDGKGGSHAEMDTFQASHALIGAYITGLWGFPDTVVQAVAFHHTPLKCPDRKFGVLTLLHVAEGLCFEAENPTTNAVSQLDTDYLDALDVTGKLVAWRKIANDVMNEESIT